MSVRIPVVDEAGRLDEEVMPVRLGEAALSASYDRRGYRPELPGYFMQPDNLQKWRAALAVAQAGGPPAKVMMVGDSTSQGPATVADSHPTYLKAELTRLGFSNRTGIITAATNIPDSRVAAPGGGYPNGWDRGNGVGPGSHCWYAGPAVSNPMYVEPGYAWDHIDVYYATVSGGGTFTVAGHSIATAGGAGLAGDTANVSGASVDNVTISAPTGGAVYMIGPEFVPDAGDEVMVVIDNWAQSGATTYDWDTGLHSLAMVSYRAPELTIIMLGTNDALTSSETASSYIARIEQITEICQASGDVLLVSPVPVNPAYTAPGGASGSLTRQQGYRDELIAYAAANNIAYLDLFGRFGQYRSGDWYRDSVHQSDAANHDIARTIAAVITA